MVADRAGVGVGGHERSRGNTKQVGEAVVVQVRDVDHDAVLLKRAHDLAAKAGKAVRCDVAAGDAVLAVPGQRDHPHAVARELVYDAQVVADGRAVLHREHACQVTWREACLDLGGIRDTGHVLRLALDVREEPARHLAVPLVRRDAAQVVWHPNGKALAPGHACQAVARKLEATVAKRAAIGNPKVGIGAGVVHRKGVQGVAVQVKDAKCVACGHVVLLLAACGAFVRRPLCAFAG